MVLGMDEVIELMLEKWKMDLAERGVEIRKKPSQEVHTFDKFMVLGAQTSVPSSVMRQLKKAFAEAENRVKNDEHGLYDQSLHDTDKPAKKESRTTYAKYSQRNQGHQRTH